MLTKIKQHIAFISSVKYTAVTQKKNPDIGKMSLERLTSRFITKCYVTVYNRS